jgi:hypothetical protein
MIVMIVRLIAIIGIMIRIQIVPLGREHSDVKAIITVKGMDRGKGGRVHGTGVSV